MLFEKLVKTVKVSVESIKMIQNASLFAYPSEQIEDVDVIVDNGFVRKTGCMIGISFKDTFSGINKIAIEENLPSYVKEFVLNHELGHIRLGHVDAAVRENQQQALYVIKRSLSRTIDSRELEADRFAYERVGRETSLKALMWMYEKTLSKEILKRVQALVN